VTISWVVAGLALLVLMGVSFSIDDPAPAASEVPVYAIDEELAPLQTGALDPEGPYADLIEPASFDLEEVRTGVAP